MESNIQGRVNVQSLTLKTQDKSREIDLSGIFVSVNIYEDLFLPFITGKLILEDTNDLQNEFPLIGGETINIMYFTDHDKIPNQFEFKVYKLEADTKATSNGDNKKLLILYFASPEQIIDVNLTISKSFDGKAETHIRNILTKYLKSNKEFDFDATDNVVKFVANFWKPTKIFQFLSRSVTSGNFSDYVFFENKNGLNFKSVSKLMEAPAFQNLEFVDDLETLYDATKIQRFHTSKYFDLMTTGKDGGFGNTVFKFDNEKYKFTKEEEDFESITQYGTSLGQNVKFADEFLGNAGVITTFKDNRHIAKRDQFLKALQNYHMVIQLTGDSTKTVGQVYNIDIRKKVREVNDPNFLLTGTWLATNVRHEINRNGVYMQNIKVVKNAFFKTDKTNKVKGKQNV